MLYASAKCIGATSSKGSAIRSSEPFNGYVVCGDALYEI